MLDLTPDLTRTVLTAALALHLLHHRLAKRHISFAEVLSAALLLVPTAGPFPAWLLMGSHTAFTLIQAIGSLRIDRLSPDWPRSSRFPFQEQ